jgi:hypothetical protein
MRASGRDEVARLSEVYRRVREPLSLIERESEAEELRAAPAADHSLLVDRVRIEVDLLAHKLSHAMPDVRLRPSLEWGTPDEGVGPVT